jgi:phytoene synthase
MQITNVLRDVREDYARGGSTCRPRTCAASAAPRTSSISPPDASAALIRFEAGGGREWFGRGLELLPLIDARSRACVRAMTGIYRRILEPDRARPQQIMRRRVSLPAWEKAWVAARSLAGAGA